MSKVSTKPKLSELKRDLREFANPEKANFFKRYFKTEKGGYGEGDRFLGVMVPYERKLAKKYQDLSLKAVTELLSSSIHEYRATALMILSLQFQKADEAMRVQIVKIYLKKIKNHINNWDLIDFSAPEILGEWLKVQNTKDRLFVLEKLARSINLWERRVAIMATYAFIKSKQFDETFKIAEILLHDDHDLIHKAVGWMLREVGNRNRKIEEKFLDRYASTMPRTMLRYAIEKFPQSKRSYYLGLK